MKSNYIKLHLSIILAGFTGIFGKLITLSEGVLVWYRMLISAIILFLIMYSTKNLKHIPFNQLVKIMGVGVLLAAHWVFFYGSIKASNVSIGVVCFSLTAFFTSIFEPIINKHKISIKEILFSLIAVIGIVLIFQLDIRYRNGIILGIISSALCSLFVIYNKKVSINQTSTTMLLYEMIGGFLVLSLLLPLYLAYTPHISYTPSGMDIIYLLILSIVCTIGMCLLQIEALRTISAFTVNLSYNLEPIYSIILAIIIFHEGKDLSYAFYIGLTLILISVILQSWDTIKTREKNTKLIK